MKKLFFITFIATCLFRMTGYAQNPAKILAPYYYKEIGSHIALPVVVGSTAPENGYMGAKADHSQNIQMDPATGKIMFFIVDGYIYDRKGRFLGIVASGSEGNTGETAIVPGTVCTNTNVYFIFSTYSDPSGPTYTSLGSYDKITIAYDAQDNLIAGSSVLSNTEVQSNLWFETLIGSSYTTYNSGGGHCDRTTLAVTKLLSGNKRYIYVMNNRRIFRMKILNNVFTYDSYYINLDSYFSPGLVTCPYGMAEMEVVTLNNTNQDLRLAFPLQTSSVNGFGTLDFSSSSGNVISGTAKVIGYSNTLINATTFFVKGAELSQNGERLYLSHDQIPVHYVSTIDMFDLTNINPFSTRHVVATDVKFKSSQIESHSDGVSLIVPEANALHRITNSDGPSLPVITSIFSLPTAYPNACSSCPYSQQVLLMQDQIDGENYGSQTAYSFSASSYTVGATTTWTSGAGNPFGAASNIYIRDELRIQAGSALTITGLNIHFGPNAKLIIENGFTFAGTNIQGGKLTLNNSTLTADVRGCNTTNMWYGVEVWGNSTVLQGSITTSQQGRLVMNSSRIEHALFGAAARKMNGSTADAARFGGVIQATNSTFYNNQNDIVVSNYTLMNNLSRFSYCVFNTNGLLNRSTLYLGAHVTLEQIKSVTLTGCTYKNQNPSVYGSVAQQGVGIWATNAFFSVVSGCSAIPPATCSVPDIRSQFTDLTYGIFYTSTVSTMSFRCDGAVFTNNILGIGATGTQNINIVRNTFNVKEMSPTTPVINQSGGVYLTGCTGYSIQENSFQEQDNPLLADGLANTYGITVKSSGESVNEIYRNKFTRLKVGGQSELINGGLQSMGNGDGLVWKCNQFIAPMFNYDLTVMNGRIGYHQGYALPSTNITDVRRAVANNKFSQNNESMLLTHDIYVSPTSPPNMNYHDYLNNDFYDLDSYTSGGMISVTHAMFSTTYLTYQADACPTNLSYGQVYLAPAKEESQSSDNLAAKSISQDVLESADYKQYLGAKAELERQSAIRAILTDASIENTDEVLVDFLSMQNDLQSQKMLAEILFLKDGRIDNALSEKLDADYLELLKAKKEFSKENSSLRPSLMKIAESKDVLVAEQAKAMLSLMEPRDLTFHFLEVETAETEENSGNASADESLRVYPNPANDRLTIRINIAEGQAVHAKVYSVIGNEAAAWKLDSDNKSFDVNHFKTGVYLIHLTDENGTLIETLKFVKE